MSTDNPLVIAGTIVALVNRIVEGIIAPIRLKFPKADLWWMMYVSWVLGSVLVFISGVNLFPTFSVPVVGQILTSVVVGGGSSILSDVLDMVGAKRKELEAKADQ